nr:hypothetical protein [uncultured Lichenicoccus sp.]
MSSNATQVLTALSSSLLGVNLRAKDVEGGLNRVKLAAAGMAGVLGGALILGGMVKLVEHGKEFVHQQSLMAQAGISQQDIAVATASAWKTAGDVIGSSAEKNIALVADLRNRLGSMKEAVMAMPAMAQLGVYLQNLTGQDQEKAGDTAARFLEQRGSLVDPVTHQISGERLEQQARILEAIAAGTRGRVGPDQLLSFQQYARAAGSTLSDEGLIHLAPVIGASKSASSVGTQLSSLDQQLLGGVMTSAGSGYLEKLGLMDPKKVHQGRGGHMTLDPGALIDGDLLRRDPVEWIHKYLGGALIKQGDVTADQQVASIMGSHLRSTVTGLIAEILRSYPALHKDAGNIDQAAGTDQYAVGQATDPTTKISAFTTAWHNLLTALGAPMVNDAVGILPPLTRGLTMLTTWASDHPRIVQTIELLAGSLGVLAVASGTAAIAAAAFGPLASSLRLLTASVAGTELASGLAGVSTGIGLVARSIPLLGAALAAGIFAGSEIRQHTNVDSWLDKELKGLDRWFATHGFAGQVPEFATPQQAARAQHFDQQGGFPTVPRSMPAPFTLPVPVLPPPARSIEKVSGSPRVANTVTDQPVDLHVHVNLDGRQISETVERQIVKNMRPAVQLGTNDFDPSMMPMPAGARY